MSNEYNELNRLLAKIETKLDNVEKNLDKISGEFTEWEREQITLRKMIDDLLEQYNIKTDKDLV